MATKAKKTTRPEVSFFRHGINVSVFANERKSKDNETFTTYNATIQRCFRDKDNKPKYTHCLAEKDWLVAATLLERAYWHVGNMRSSYDEQTENTEELPS